MEEKTAFQSEVRYDLATYREFNRISIFTTSRTTCFGILYVLCMFYLLSALEYSSTAKMVLALSLFSLGTGIYQWFRNRDGGIPYKRVVRGNKDHIPHYQTTIAETGITSRNLDSGNEVSYSFVDFRSVQESKRLLILVDDLKTSHIIDKSTLTGGSPEELVSFLREKCPKLKKRVRKGYLGRIIWYLMRIVPVIMLLASLATLFHIPEKLRGQFTNDTPAAQMVEELAELDIRISSQTLDAMLLWESDDTSFYPEYYGASKAYDLLCMEGMGRYDSETGVWTPSESGLYWFDVEVMYVECIYSDFLRGVDAMDDSLTFSNVAEDYSRANKESGRGDVLVSFDYLNQHHELEAEYYFDWFDTDMIYHLGRILAADSDPRELWMISDGQGILLYYGTEAEKDRLTEKTGVDFFDCVTMRMGH